MSVGNVWLIKSEPDKYSWDDLNRDGRTFWDGVRNYQARNNLQAMQVGDLCLYYHSVAEKQIVGLARVVRQAYQDPTTEDERWRVVDVEPFAALKRPLSLEAIKGDEVLREMAIVRQSRLSVAPVTREQFERVLALTGTQVTGVSA